MFNILKKAQIRGGLRKGKIGNTRNTGKDGWLGQRAFSQFEAGQFCPPSMERGHQVTLTKTTEKQMSLGDRLCVPIGQDKVYYHTWLRQKQVYSPIDPKTEF